MEFVFVAIVVHVSRANAFRHVSQLQRSSVGTQGQHSVSSMLASHLVSVHSVHNLRMRDTEWRNYQLFLVMVSLDSVFKALVLSLPDSDDRNAHLFALTGASNTHADFKFGNCFI